jgi:hypothetical protein
MRDGEGAEEEFTVTPGPSTPAPVNQEIPL